MKKPNHRVFDYPPRFYKPEEDEQERKKRKLGFTRQRKHGRKKKSPLLWVVLAIFVVFIYLKLQGLV
ncbi:MAG: hypothetical protein R6W90_11895 [Ignavibacteriaceae bacterium]